MSWLRHLIPRQRDGRCDDARADQRLDEASAFASELETRGEKVAAALRGRKGRNHWGETVAAIARGSR